MSRCFWRPVFQDRSSNQKTGQRQDFKTRSISVSHLFRQRSFHRLLWLHTSTILELITHETTSPYCFCVLPSVPHRGAQRCQHTRRRHACRRQDHKCPTMQPKEQRGQKIHRSDGKSRLERVRCWTHSCEACTSNRVLGSYFWVLSWWWFERVFCGVCTA